MIKDLNKALNVMAENDDMAEFLAVLKTYINKENKFSVVLKKTGMSKEQLQDILDDKTDFYFDDAVAILRALNLKLTVEPIS